jgi:hypothetical protein
MTTEVSYPLVSNKREWNHRSSLIVHFTGTLTRSHLAKDGSYVDVIDISREDVDICWRGTLRLSRDIYAEYMEFPGEGEDK